MSHIRFAGSSLFNHPDFDFVRTTGFVETHTFRGIRRQVRLVLYTTATADTVL
jgi:hypothetical protein